MSPLNTQLSTSNLLSRLYDVLYRYRFIIAVLFAILLFFTSCKKLKAAAGDQQAIEQLFEENFLNKNYVVEFASDSSIDITADYAGYTFYMTKTNSYYDGPMTGTKDGITYTGTWQSNEDYSKLVINISSPSTPAPFVFLNRQWRFTKKAVPVMELAPWGSDAPMVLKMRRL